jgi:hypothetical protein
MGGILVAGAAYGLVRWQVKRREPAPALTAEAAPGPLDDVPVR